MEDKKRIAVGIISRLFATYGACVVAFCVLCYIIGDTAAGYTPLFEMGRKGMTISTLVQLMLLAIFITIAQEVFLTDRIIKDMSIILRKIIFFVLIMLAMVGMIILFKWFPLNDIKAWLGFIISYAVCMGISTLLTRLNEMNENTKMQEALEKYNKGDK